MRNIKRKFLVSVDDGSLDDLEIADLLLKYEIPAVFYIPGNCDLTEDQIKKLAGLGSCKLRDKIRKLFDIGAHTLTHPQDLKRLNDEELMKEIAGSKAWLERIIKRPVTKFAYPRGRFDERVKEKVRLAGFKEARTTRILNTDFPDDPFETDATIHLHPDRKEYKEKTWNEVGFELFDKVVKEGGRFELFMHSWEVAKYNMEEFLEDFLAYMHDELKRIKYEDIYSK